MFRDEEFAVLLQAALVGLQRQDVIGFFVDDLLRDRPLAADGVDGHDGPFDRQHVQQFGNGDDLVGLPGHLDLTEHQTLTRREGRDHMDGGRAFRPVMRTAQRLAVDGNHTLWQAGDCANPGGETMLEHLCIERRQDIAEVVVGRRSILERREPTQHIQPLGTEERDRGDALGTRHHGREA